MEKGKEKLIKTSVCLEEEVKEMIDLHTHGIDKYGTNTKDPENILKLAELHRKKGTSYMLPAIYPNTIEKMRENIEAVRRAMETDKTILGVYLEGPFLNPLMGGALDKNSFLKPSVENLKKLIGGFEDIIKIITIAPELKGALRLIEKCTELGIRVNMGHSDATLRQGLDGKHAGAKGITHIFNAMRPFHHREPGIAGLGLLDDDLYVEIIGDGVHLSPETLKIIFRIKDKNRIILVSDSVKGAKGKPLYKKGVLQGGGMSLMEQSKVLKKIGIPEGWIMKAAVDNPKRYLKDFNKNY